MGKGRQKGKGRMVGEGRKEDQNKKENIEVGKKGEREGQEEKRKGTGKK